jgi:hypothetical protein
MGVRRGIKLRLKGRMMNWMRINKIMMSSGLSGLGGYM